ncbi:Monocarboxylate transporter [Lachancea thermotolerans]
MSQDNRASSSLHNIDYNTEGINTVTSSDCTLASSDNLQGDTTNEKLSTQAETEAQILPTPLSSKELAEAAQSEEQGGLYASDEYVDPPPDGGYGWVCCACVAVFNFATWGPNTSWGVFLSYFLSSHYFPDATPTDFALIGGLVIGLTLLLLPLASVCMNFFGYKPTLTFAILLEAAAFVASSFAKSVGVLYVTYGVMLGISFGLIFGSSTIIIPGWFLKKRALANGAGHFGVGLGGLVFSFAVRAMIDRTGDHRWAMRMLAAVTLFLNLISLCFVRVRKTAFDQNRKSAGQILKAAFDVSVLKIKALHFCSLWSWLANVGYVILMFSMSNYATSIGMTSQQATVALAVFNGSQAFGRPFMGWFAEAVGRCNATIIIMVYNLIILLPFWFTLTKFRELIPFCIMLGFGAGVGAVNIVPLVADVVGIEKFAAGIGYGMFGNGAGSVFAEVIGLHLRQPSSAKPYLHCQIFVACMYFAGLLCLLPYRELKVQRILTARARNEKYSEETRQRYSRLLEPTFKCYIARTFLVAEA